MIYAGGGENVIEGGPGNDVIYARNGQQDTIYCGRGVDTVYVDAREDGVFDCEIVKYPKGS